MSACSCQGALVRGIAFDGWILRDSALWFKLFPLRSRKEEDEVTPGSSREEGESATGPRGEADPPVPVYPAGFAAFMILFYCPSLLFTEED